MPKFKSKVVVIEAVQFTNAKNILSIKALAGINFELVAKEDRGDNPDNIAQVFDITHNTWIGVKLNEWIIKGTKGELYPCDPDVFEEKYEATGKSPSRK